MKQNTFKTTPPPKVTGVLKLNPPVFEDAVQATRDKQPKVRFNRLFADVRRYV
jgi:hypothetical protein